MVFKKLFGNLKNKRDVVTSLSLYIHVPFCKSKCNYCDFYSVKISDDLEEKFTERIVNDLKILALEYLYDIKIDSIYFGGGTPSILKENNLEKIFNFLNLFNISKECEITLEANPESFTPEKAKFWKNIGINRLSIGVQSLDNNVLKNAGRMHDLDKVKQIFSLDIMGDYDNVNVDFIYGLPLQNKNSIEKIILFVKEHASIIKHISLYELTIAKGTVFHNNKNKLKLPSEKELIEYEKFLISELTKMNYKRYEVSNFAQSGYESKHNACYWDYKPYIGLGPSAHSFINFRRFSQPADITKYLSFPKNEFAVDLFEELDKRAVLNELIFLGLRRSKGIDLKKMKKYCGIDLVKSLKEVLPFFIKENMLTLHNEYISPTDIGINFADNIAVNFINYLENCKTFDL